MTDSLDKSSFYRSLLTTFHDQFVKASDNCWVICIPPNKRMKDIRLDVQVIQAHLLKPSPFLKDHYIPVNSTHIEDIQLDGQSMVVKEVSSPPKSNEGSHRSPKMVKILAVEDAYNSKSNLYRIVMIDRPLLTKHLDIAENEVNILSKEVVNVDDCAKYLKNLSKKAFAEVESNTAKLRVTVKEDVQVDQLVEMFASVISWSVECFLKDPSLDEDDLDLCFLESAIESIILSPFHETLMKVIRKDLVEIGSVTSEKAAIMKNKKLDMKSLGADEDLEAFSMRPELVDRLNGLSDLTTPLEKTYTFQQVMNDLRNDLIECLESSHSPFDDGPPKTLIPDDLVAATIVSLVYRVRDIQEVFFNIRFIQTFGTKLPAMNEMAYYRVTFEVALAYIQNYSPNNEVMKNNQSSSRTNECLEESFDSGRSQRSLSSLTSRDTRYDKQLQQLNRMIEELSTSGDDPRPTRSPPSSPSTVPNNQDLGDFLSQLKTSSMYGFASGRR